MELNKIELEAWQLKTERLSGLKEALKTKREIFEEHNKEIISRILELSTELMEEQDGFKLLAEKEFRQTGNKKLLGGIGIREGVLINYDSKEALNWAQDHKLCLTLDKREFDKIAKTQDIDFVTKEHKITVTFPKEIKFEVD